MRAALNTAALANTVQMLTGAEHREINLMPYAKRKKQDEDRELSAEEEFSAIDAIFR